MKKRRLRAVARGDLAESIRLLGEYRQQLDNLTVAYRRRARTRPRPLGGDSPMSVIREYKVAQDINDLADILALFVQDAMEYHVDGRAPIDGGHELSLVSETRGNVLITIVDNSGAAPEQDA